MVDYAENKIANNGNKNREPYTLLKNNCGHFAANCITQDKTINRPAIYDPRPVSIVDEFETEKNKKFIYIPQHE